MNDAWSLPSASTLPSGPPQVRAILFGLECLTTKVALERLIAAGVGIRVVCLPGPPGTTVMRAPITRRHLGPPLAMASSRDSVAGFAASHEVEVWRVGDLRAGETTKAVAALEADALIVACFDRRIPAALYECQPLGGVNIHPSLLPDKRGPDPLFWTFKLGDRQTGSTVHRLTPRFDAGDILAQQSVDVADGISEDELDASLARLGADLTVDVITGLLEGDISPRPQDEAAATWAPHPTLADFCLDRAGTARAAFNFMRGIEGRGQPFSAVVGGLEISVDRAIAWAANPDALPPPSSDQALIAFSDGVVLAAVASTDG